MAFKDIPNIESYDVYLTTAVNRAKKAADSMRSALKLEPLKKSQTLEIERIKVISKSLNDSLMHLLKAFPSFEQLTPFYQDLMHLTLDVKQMRRSLADLNYACNKTREFSEAYISKIKLTGKTIEINKHRKEFLGRTSNLIKKMKPSFAYLEQCRKQFLQYPTIKSMFTVAIAGFPNVGKSTLLKHLTGADVAIKDYAFTTTRLLVGYADIKNDKVQFIDTPGTLNREDKMNPIEQQAYLALKHVANVIVYVFDPTDSYPFDDQVKLFKRITKYEKPTICYLSKTDISTKEQIALFERFKCLAKEDILKEVERLQEQ